MVFRTYTDDVLIDGENTRRYEAAEAILAGQTVKADQDSAGRTVEPSDADGEAVLGVALQDAAAGQQVTVARDGCIVRATSGTGTIASGDPVASHGATGEEGELDTAVESDATVATPVEGDFILGWANADDAGANDDVIVEINLGRV